MRLSVHTDEHFMKEALKEAQLAMEEGEIPIGAVIVCDNRIIARAHNQTERLNDSTAHAEMIALTSAFGYFGAKYLSECTLYVTLEPCVMCAGALHWSQLQKIVYGASDPKRGFARLSENVLHPKTKIVKGLMQQEATTLLNLFFKKIRNK